MAHDYDRASALAKYMIFDLEEPHHWPVCARKIGLRSQMAAIKDDSRTRPTPFDRRGCAAGRYLSSPQNSWMRLQPSRRLAMSVA